MGALSSSTGALVMILALALAGCQSSSSGKTWGGGWSTPEDLAGLPIWTPASGIQVIGELAPPRRAVGPPGRHPAMRARGKRSQPRPVIRQAAGAITLPARASPGVGPAEPPAQSRAAPDLHESKPSSRSGPLPAPSNVVCS